MLTILIVDDYDETIESLSILYRMHSPNIRILVAHDSSEAFRVLRSGIRIDIASIDIQLGNDSGIELCKQIHDRYPQIYIVMCSLEASGTNKNIAQRMGASQFLAKPVTRKDVNETIQLYMEEKLISIEQHMEGEGEWLETILGYLERS